MSNEAHYVSLATVSHTVHSIQCADKNLTLSAPRIMGILNVTPDSFYDGGRFNSREHALQRVAEMIEQGADIIDVGAESSRPYAVRISLQEEIDRLLEILVAIKQRFDVVLSVDTYKPEVMLEAIKAGVHMINDIYALQVESALEVVAKSNVAVCLMHMQGMPSSMQDNPAYTNIVAEIIEFLEERSTRCLQAGIARNRIVIDPGFGFGKITQHNMVLLQNLAQLTKIGFPLLVGLSRKASIGELLSLPVSERLIGSISAHVIAVMKGAAIIRTHDIKPTAEALKIAIAVLAQETMAWS